MRRSSPVLAFFVLAALLAGTPSPAQAPSESDRPGIRTPHEECGRIGTKRDDRIEGGKGNNVICGLAGDDVLIGGGGDDVLHGGPGDDVLHGDAGNDDLFGGIGFDVCRQNKGKGVLGTCERPKPEVEEPPRTGNVFGACPVPGGLITDSFGDPRSGGRSHQGVDIIAKKGTKIFAAIKGAMENGRNELGGKTSYVRQKNGTFIYNAHLNDYAPERKRVDAGALVGYVGRTGNAQGGVFHLHFEYHPKGGAAIDPYDDLKKVCRKKATFVENAPAGMIIHE